MAFLTTDMSEMLTAEDLDKLQKNDVWTINDLFSAELMDVKRATNIRFQVLRDLKDKVKQKYTLPCRDLNFLYQRSLKDCRMIATGLPELTAALGGGLQTQEIVEFSGDSESGKTEMCYSVCGEILSHYDDFHILYIASNFDFDYEKVAKYTRSKAGNRLLTEDDIHKALSRVQIARPTKLSELVHLLNTFIHNDRKNTIKCLMVDSLSFLIQEEVLSIRTTNLDDADELEKLCALKGMSRVHLENGAINNIRKEILDGYLYEVMKLLTNIALTKNAMVVLTSSEPSFTNAKAWTNAIDHRIHLSKMPDFSSYVTNNPRSTVCRATILKTCHFMSQIGLTIPFEISDEGLFAIRLATQEQSK